MATNSSLEADFASFIIPLSGKFIPYLATAFMFMLLAYAVGDHGSKPEIPELNPSKPLEFTNRRRVNEFSRNSKQMLLKGKAQFGSNLHRLRCGWGEVFVVPPQVMHEVRNDPRLGAAEAQADDAHSYLPGFEPFSNEPALPKVITKYLTRALTKVTKALSEEATLVIREVLTDSTEWHQITPKEDTLQIVSRLSSRVFMGEELCRDEEWIRASKEYTAYFFPLLSELGLTPRWARPFVHWFRPDCWRLRSLQAECRRAMKPHLERRKALKKAALARGESLVFDDSIEWWEKERPKIIVDPAMQQITMSLVAIHTTADLLQQVMIDLALHPELFQPLREELVRVLSAEGLKKTALYNLKLMDSVCKETQRLKPVLLATFRRLVLEDIKMPNGWVFRKGEKIVTTNVNMWDSEYYENPLDYDGYRFLKMRSTEEEKSAHFVSTSEKHFGFGHGPHACPGRFFAANEVKIALAHLLLKYDWKLPEGADDPQPTSFGMMMVPDPNAVLLIRRRKEEIDLDSLET